MDPLQSSKDLWKTTTANKFHIWQNAHILKAEVPPPIEQRSLENHYTKADAHIEECLYTKGRGTPQSSIDHLKTTTPNKFHRNKNADIPMADRLHPPSIDHRSMEDHYTYSCSHIEECTDTSADRPNPLLQ